MVLITGKSPQESLRWTTSTQRARAARSILNDRNTSSNQSQQIPLLLARPATDCGQLDRTDRAIQVSPGLVHAAQTPSQRTQRLPPPHRLQIDRRATPRGVSLE